eukprot:SAG11_NODE_2062_length_3871_cov_4.740986_2_plen_62_part_00
MEFKRGWFVGDTGPVRGKDSVSVMCVTEIPGSKMRWLSPQPDEVRASGHEDTSGNQPPELL